MSIIIMITLVFGIVSGKFFAVDTSFINSISSWMLYLLIFSVGIDIGMNKEVFGQIKKLGVKILLVPFGVAVGSLFGGMIMSFFVQIPWKESMAISAGMGWYSLSGVMLTEAGYPVSGTISFLSNVFREILTFFVVPFLAKYLNGYCAIAPGGATAMDTTLPVISRNTNGKIAIIAFVSGITLTAIIPFLMQIFL